MTTNMRDVFSVAVGNSIRFCLKGNGDVDHAHRFSRRVGGFAPDGSVFVVDDHAPVGMRQVRRFLARLAVAGVEVVLPERIASILSLFQPE